MIRHVVVCVVLIGLLQAIPTSSMTSSPPPPPLKFVAGPGTVGGDVNQSAALEWTLDKVPENYHIVAIFFKGIRVFQYTPCTGIIAVNITDPRFSIYNTTTKSVGFRLGPILPGDAGNYTCELTGITKEDESWALLVVQDVPTVPTITETPGGYVEGETNVTLTCTANSTSLPVTYRPAMLYTWSRNGVDIDRTGPPERHTVLGDSGQTLEISPVHHTDITYTCTASENGTNLSSEETKTLDILYGPLNISIHPENPTLAFNETLVVTAYATCHPTCDFEWLLGSDVISLNSTLTLDGSDISSTETYQVTAANEHWSQSLSATVTYIPGEVPDEPTTTAWTIVTNPNGNSSAADPGTEDKPDDNTIIIIAVSVVLAVVVIATIVIVVVILVRKKKLKEGGAEEFDELTPYVTVSRPTESGTQPANQPANQSGNQPLGHEDLPSGQPHPEVIPPVIYAEVIKKTKGAGSTTKPTLNGKGDTKPAGKPPPTIKKPKLRDKPPPIAPRKAKENGAEEFDELNRVQSDGNRNPTRGPTNESDREPVREPVTRRWIFPVRTTSSGGDSPRYIRREDDAKPPGKPPPTAKKPTLRKRPPPITPPKAVPDMDQSGLGLTNAAFEATGDDMTTWEHTYSNVPAPSTLSEVQLQGNSKYQGQSPEGITYADIAFVANGNVNNDVVRREVEPIEYATLKLRHTVPGAEDC